MLPTLLIACSGFADTKSPTQQPNNETNNMSSGLTLMVTPNEGGELDITSAMSAALVGVKISVPAGAVRVNTLVTIAAGAADVAADVTDEESTVSGIAVDFQPDGQVFAKPANITLPADVNVEEGMELVVYAKQGSGDIEVIEAAAITVDETAGKLSFEISHFTAFQSRQRRQANRSTCSSDNDCSGSDLCCDLGARGSYCMDGARCRMAMSGRNPSMCTMDSDCDSNAGETCCNTTRGLFCLERQTCAGLQGGNNTQADGGTSTSPMMCRMDGDCDSSAGETCCRTDRGLYCLDRQSCADAQGGNTQTDGGTTTGPMMCMMDTDCTVRGEVCCDLGARGSYCLAGARCRAAMGGGTGTSDGGNTTAPMMCMMDTDCTVRGEVCCDLGPRGNYCLDAARCRASMGGGTSTPDSGPRPPNPVMCRMDSDCASGEKCCPARGGNWCMMTDRSGNCP